MVTLPPPFTATKYPGYFWHTEEKKLYSIKMSGELSELKKVFPNYFNHLPMPGYTVSFKGRRKYLSIDYLNKLTLEDSEINVQKR
jgi:hypothetical protein